MVKFNEKSLDELSKKFPQVPNRKLTMESNLEDLHEAQKIIKDIKRNLKKRDKRA